ncbi:hypothetical protein PMSD_15545 [Paenibacillus macquariensis subsp. defensor]|nr:hypothetical protein PMSD_15545 [Paenibacillus macquariensis subsp. defensor]
MNQMDILFNKIIEDYNKVTDKELTELILLINSMYHGYDPILLSLTKKELIRNTDYITRATYELTKRKGIWDTSSKHYILSNLCKSRFGIDSTSRKNIFIEKNMWLYNEIDINGTYIKFKFVVKDDQPILLMKHVYGYRSITSIIEKILTEINTDYLSDYGFSLMKDNVLIYYRDLIIEGMEPQYDNVILNENLKIPRWSTIEGSWFEMLWSEISEDQELIKEPIFFENRLGFTAYKKIIEILNSAKKSIIIIDPYFDDNTLQIIEAVNVNIHVKFLTSKLQGSTKTSFSKFKKERGNIELKNTDKIHDRYVILDLNKVYLLGSSLNNFGDKATTIVPLHEPFIKGNILSFFEKTWNQIL